MKKYIVLAVIGIAMAALGVYETLWCVISPQGSHPFIWLFTAGIGFYICLHSKVNPVIKKIFS